MALAQTWEVLGDMDEYLDRVRDETIRIEASTHG